MKVILAGCEYSGTTTLAYAIRDWMEEQLGTQKLLVHDHWKMPHTSGHPLVDESHLPTEDERQQLLALSPKLKEMIQRHSLVYHTFVWPGDGDRLMIGYVFDEAVYGPLYLGYGGDAEGMSRSAYGRYLEHHLLVDAPETVLVHVTASPGVIAERMERHPHADGLLQKQDIELVLEAFEVEIARSLIMKRIVLDTSRADVEETLDAFLEGMEPHLTSEDRLRMVV